MKHYVSFFIIIINNLTEPLVKAIINYNDYKKELSNMKFKNTKLALNQLVADLSQASAAIHQIHWYLRGAHFITWHERMDDYRESIESQLDEVAERLIIIDGSPYSTLEEFANYSKIKSIAVSWNQSVESHLQRLVEVLRVLAISYQELIEVAGKEEDNISEDLAIGFKAEIEKTIWMLQAELGQSPQIDA